MSVEEGLFLHSLGKKPNGAKHKESSAWGFFTCNTQLMAEWNHFRVTLDLIKKKKFK